MWLQNIADHFILNTHGKLFSIFFITSGRKKTIITWHNFICHRGDEKNTKILSREENIYALKTKDGGLNINQKDMDDIKILKIVIIFVGFLVFLFSAISLGSDHWLEDKSGDHVHGLWERCFNGKCHELKDNKREVPGKRLRLPPFPYPYFMLRSFLAIFQYKI